LPWPGLNPQILSPIASTLTITPPRRQDRYNYVQLRIGQQIFTFNKGKYYLTTRSRGSSVNIASG
jgi:hypothetical protein